MFIPLFAPFVRCCVIACMYAVSLMCQWGMRLVIDPNDQFWEVQSRPYPPAVLNDSALGNHSYIQTTNLRFHYVENGNKSNPLMLMLHGYPEFWYSWRHQLRNLSSKYWTVAVDMRGYGDTDKPEGADNYELEILVNDIKELILALGREKCILVARDWGGIVGFCFVLLHPDMVISYVFMNTVHPTVLNNALFESHSQVNRSWYMFFYTMPCLAETRNRMDDMAWLVTTLKSENVPSPMTNEDIEAWKYTFGQTRAFTGPLNYYRGNVPFKITKKIEGLGCQENPPPGLVCFGKRDYILDLLQQPSVDMVCNCRLKYIDNATHFVQQDNPDAVNTEMWNFLAEVETNSTGK